jgi:hypothetical protein
MSDTAIPDLTLQGLPRGPEQSPIDLRWLLYNGAASTYGRNVKKVVESGRLGQPLLERLPLLEAIHRRWQAGVAAGTMGAERFKEQWRLLRSFVAFSEEAKTHLTIARALDLYVAYCAHIKHRSSLSAMTQYQYSIGLAAIVASVLGMDARKLQWKTRIRMPKRLGNRAAKENLHDTAAFVRTLLETVEQLPVEVIRGPLPVTLRYSAGGEYVIHIGRPLQPLHSLKLGDAFKHRRAVNARERRANDISNKARTVLINLRLEAELLIFINQTGSNLAQALRLTGSQVRYQSHGDYLQLFVWKNRAKHAVELRIHKGYRTRFEAYLKWRSAVFPDDRDGLMFPFLCNDGDHAMRRTCWAFRDVRKLMKSIGQPFVHSQQLRKTIANFTKRKVSRQAAAELLSNKEKTFRESYEEVHHQASVSELVNFWSDSEALVSAVGPGGCQQAAPQSRSDAPDSAPKPDCESGGGCLFCDKNRDLRSFDHVWNLASLHHLKLVEFNADRTPLSQKKGHPVALTIERIAAKLHALMAVGGRYAEWVTEARLRVKEGRYHPFYTAAFDILEGAR